MIVLVFVFVLYTYVKCQIKEIGQSKQKKYWHLIDPPVSVSEKGRKREFCKLFIGREEADANDYKKKTNRCQY